MESNEETSVKEREWKKTPSFKILRRGLRLILKQLDSREQRKCKIFLYIMLSEKVASKWVSLKLKLEK